MYRDRTLNPGNLFRCVKHYKLYLAYRAGERFEGPTQDERQYRDALRDLTDRLAMIEQVASGEMWLPVEPPREEG